ncbi:SDR family NAD(P)-dependent oxidoreductase [Nocardia australiensis]|uniref:SDR family NAD(P)-dependent oxidoreductase n=1 Tax=Nocardia australiensis TaxID=2887191 RepID=UPI001D13A462|nr:SDR family NAD(P)-dependent oxidoreductase [Nocardia australiensis]
MTGHDESTRPLALITGGSSGIGAALAHTFAVAGYDLVLLARHRDRLEQIAAQVEESGAAVEIVCADLSTPEGLATAARRAAQGDLRVLISNAGTSGYLPLHELTDNDLDRLWRLNATAPLTLAHAALPSLLNRGQGGIVTVASLLAFSAGLTESSVPLPHRTLYAAAKSATVAFTRTLASELAGTGVTATVVCPGRIATSWSGGSYHGQPGVMSAPDVATATIQALDRGETICVPGLSDPAPLDRLVTVEHTLLSDGNRSSLAPRYRPATS